MKTVTALSLTVVAFGAGLAVRTLPGAQAAPEPGMVPQIVHVMALTNADLGGPPDATLHSKTFAAADGATVSVQTGNVAKHYHADANELQYIVEGSGTFWLGDKQYDVAPGDLIVIPKGTPHAGSKATTGQFKAIAIKTPPQLSGDTHPVN